LNPNSKILSNVSSVLLIYEINAVAIGYEDGNFEINSLLNISDSPLFSNQLQYQISHFGLLGNFIWICEESPRASASLFPFEVITNQNSHGTIKHELKLGNRVLTKFFENSTKLEYLKCLEDETSPKSFFVVQQTVNGKKKTFVELFDLLQMKDKNSGFVSIPVEISKTCSISVFFLKLMKSGFGLMKIPFSM
jgi:hypothetical protein